MVIEEFGMLDWTQMVGIRYCYTQHLTFVLSTLLKSPSAIVIDICIFVWPANLTHKDGYQVRLQIVLNVWESPYFNRRWA